MWFYGRLRWLSKSRLKQFITHRLFSLEHQAKNVKRTLTTLLHTDCLAWNTQLGSIVEQYFNKETGNRKSASYKFESMLKL